ncbi:unnamed protein product, partial [Ilex paraguariensis]
AKHYHSEAITKALDHSEATTKTLSTGASADRQVQPTEEDSMEALASYALPLDKSYSAKD